MSPTLGSAAQAGGMAFRKVLFLGATTVVFALIIISSLGECIQQKSVVPLVVNVLYRMVLVTNDLAQASRDVLASGGFYNGSQGLWKGSAGAFMLGLNLFSAIFIIYMWLKLLARGLSKFFYSGGHVFTEWALAIVFFFVLQMLGILIAAGANNQIDGFSGNPNSAISFLTLPFMAFYDFFRACLYLIPQLDLTAGISERVSEYGIIKNPSKSAIIQQINITVNSTGR